MKLLLRKSLLWPVKAERFRVLKDRKKQRRERDGSLDEPSTCARFVDARFRVAALGKRSREHEAG